MVYVREDSAFLAAQRELVGSVVFGRGGNWCRDRGDSISF